MFNKTMVTRYIVLAALLCSLNINAAESISIEGLGPYSAIASLVAEVLNTNPGIQSAQAALDAASARERANNQPIYNPELEFEAEDAIDQSASIGINQTIDWRNKRSARGGIASFEREASAADLHRLRQEVALELLNAISQYDVASRLFKLSDEREQLMRQFATLASQRRELGDLGQVEFDLAHLALAEAEIQQTDSAIFMSGAQQELSAVIGKEESPLSELPDPPLDASVPTLNIDNILYDLPTMRVQIARIAAAKGVVKLRTLEKQPDPTIGARIGQEESDLLAGITISVPLYLRNNYTAEVETASAEVIQFELEAQDMYRRSRAQLVTSLERYRLAGNAWKNWVDTGQHHLGNQLSVLERLWRAGEISTTDYLVQVNQTLNARKAAQELRARVWQSWIDWLAASGAVDTWLGLETTQ